MIIKPSALKNTHYFNIILETPLGKSFTEDDIDQPIGWHIPIELLDDMHHIDIPVAIIDGTGQLEEGSANGATTTYVDTGEPAIALFITRGASAVTISRLFIHEYRHAMQIRAGRLRFEGKDLYWDGVKQDALSPKPVTKKYAEAALIIGKLKYMAQPWEFEADHMIRGNSLPGMVFHRLIKRYGTTWPVHWSPEYVAKRYYALKDWRAVIEELYNDGF